jgi:hypothetical protein
MPTILESEGLVDKVNASDDAEPTPIPDWFQLDIGEIYDHLNPRTTIDGNGKRLTSIGVVANHLLKILVSKKFLLDSPLNTKLQSKKLDHEQQRMTS